MPRLALALLLLPAAARADDLRLNQVQVIGTHNSYKIAPAPGVMKLLAAFGGDRATKLDYTHRPLPEQFDQLGIRQIELDVYADPKGGLFANPLLYRTAKGQGLDAGPDPNPGGVLDKPGFKVLHAPDADYRTTVHTLAAGLDQVRAWSKAHPRHVPILVLIELKEDPIPLLPTTPVKFDQDLFAAVDAEILKAFPRDAVVTPDDVRGAFATLPEAITKRGWPTLDAARGKVLFALDNDGKLADAYLEGHPALTGRVMFATVGRPDHPAAGWFKVNEAVKDFDKIQKLVKAGFLVRTRADVETAEARANDPTRRDKALASGAQYVSTDYPEPRKEWSEYAVRLPGGAAARVNPVSGPAGAAGGDVERLPK
jgi:hypothetical protein